MRNHHSTTCRPVLVARERAARQIRCAGRLLHVLRIRSPRPAPARPGPGAAAGRSLTGQAWGLPQPAGEARRLSRVIRVPLARSSRWRWTGCPAGSCHPGEGHGDDVPGRTARRRSSLLPRQLLLRMDRRCGQDDRVTDEVPAPPTRSLSAAQTAPGPWRSAHAGDCEPVRVMDTAADPYPAARRRVAGAAGSALLRGAFRRFVRGTIGDSPGDSSGDSSGESSGSAGALERRSRAHKLLDGLVGACKLALATGSLPAGRLPPADPGHHQPPRPLPDDHRDPHTGQASQGGQSSHPGQARQSGPIGKAASPPCSTVPAGLGHRSLHVHPARPGSHVAQTRLRRRHHPRGLAARARFLDIGRASRDFRRSSAQSHHRAGQGLLPSPGAHHAARGARPTISSTGPAAESRAPRTGRCSAAITTT